VLVLVLVVRDGEGEGEDGVVDEEEGEYGGERVVVVGLVVVEVVVLAEMRMRGVSMREEVMVDRQRRRRGRSAFLCGIFLLCSIYSIEVRIMPAVPARRRFKERRGEGGRARLVCVCKV
jgi:hypothetical protein